MSIHLAGVSVRLDETEILREVSLNLDARTVAIIGENGSGKSTFARLIGGLITRTAGDLSVLGLDPSQNAAALRARIAIVFSNPDAQIVMPTVAEDVAFSLRPERLRRAESTSRVRGALERFGLQELGASASHDLSSGQKQLLAVCGAFVRRPELVIADEPTAYLDARNARRVADHLLADTGHRLLLATHDLELAERCDLAVLFSGGRVAVVGEPAAVVARYEAELSC